MLTSTLLCPLGVYGNSNYIFWFAYAKDTRNHGKNVTAATKGRGPRQLMELMRTPFIPDAACLIKHSHENRHGCVSSPPVWSTRVLARFIVPFFRKRGVREACFAVLFFRLLSLLSFIRYHSYILEHVHHHHEKVLSVCSIYSHLMESTRTRFFLTEADRLLGQAIPTLGKNSLLWEFL